MSSRESLLVLRCFRCDAALEPVTPDDTTQPNGGVTFVATGNYGSTVFDPIRGDTQLHAVICDNCVTDWADRLIAVDVTQPRATFHYRPLKSIEEVVAYDE